MFYRLRHLTTGKVSPFLFPASHPFHSLNIIWVFFCLCNWFLMAIDLPSQLQYESRAVTVPSIHRYL